ncbi:IS1595 family transposase [Nostoc sp. NIES-2111]
MAKAASISGLREFDSFFELVSFFDTEEKCSEYLALLRWNGNITCPYCSTEGGYALKGKTRRYKCRGCRRQFGVRVGTIFEDSPISLRKWFYAVYLITSHKKGISSHQLGRDLKVTQKTAWFMLQRIRQAFAPLDTLELEDTVEVDETFVGGRESNKHKSKRVEGTQGRSLKTKAPVLGILQRGGKVYAVPMEATSRETIVPIVEQKVKAGSVIYTDEYQPYKALGSTFTHLVVRHGVGEYVKGEVHTNSLEGFWSHFKRGIHGIYHHTSKWHLHLYVHEYTFRYNNRKMSEGSRFDVLLANTEGKGITYKALTNGNGRSRKGQAT